MKRRDVLRGALATPFLFSTVGCASLFRSQKDPFTLGIASGSPTPDGVVLWTRLAPEPLVGNGGMGPSAVAVKWEVAEDEGFKKIVQSGESPARPELGHSVHVEVSGLQPDRWYFYRFHTTDATSPVGRTRTTPALGAAASRLRLAYASCQNRVYGYYDAYRGMANENLDLVVYLGDYIYEYGEEKKDYYVRTNYGPECKSLDEYRTRYGQYKSTEPDLMRMHALAPWIMTWDDHEVGNDLANDRLEDDNDPKSVLARRVNAYQAYYEHMPLRAADVRRAMGSPNMRVYGATRWGQLANIYLTDVRQYRDHQSCPNPKKKGGGNIVEEAKCAELKDPKRTNLGAEQERWLLDAMGNSSARWNILAQQTLFAQVDVNFEGDARKFRTDAWDGYPVSRQRILDMLANRKPSNPIIIGGDVHSNWVSDVKANYNDPKSPVIGTEFVGTSICSRYPSWTKGKDETAKKIAEKNPHVKFTQVEKRGYSVLEVTPDSSNVTLKVVDDWKKPGSSISTWKKFVVPNGKPGVQEA